MAPEDDQNGLEDFNLGRRGVQEVFDRFGEPTTVKPEESGHVIFEYPEGEIKIPIMFLLPFDRDLKLLEYEELQHPWTFNYGGSWDGPFSNVPAIIAQFSLDRVPGSIFSARVVEKIYPPFPPKIEHPYFDKLPTEVQHAIIEKLKPHIPTPNQSAARYWKEILDDPFTECLRLLIISLQMEGTASWREEKLFIGRQRIDCDDLNVGKEFYEMTAEMAAQMLLAKAKRLLAQQLNPLQNPFQTHRLPQEDEPLLGIPSAEDWRRKFLHALNLLSEGADIEKVDAARLASRKAVLAHASPNIIRMIDLGKQKGVKSPAPTVSPEFNEIPVDGRGWFTCPKGHTERLDGADRQKLRSLKTGEKIELICKTCRAAVGVVLGKL